MVDVLVTECLMLWFVFLSVLFTSQVGGGMPGVVAELQQFIGK